MGREDDEPRSGRGERDRSRRDRSRSRTPPRRRRSRSRSRDRSYRRRSRTPPRRSRRSPSPPRYRRDRRDRSRSRDRDRRRERSPSNDYGGYQPRRRKPEFLRGERSDGDGLSIVNAWGKDEEKKDEENSEAAMKQEIDAEQARLERQKKAQQWVLQQQAASIMAVQGQSDVPLGGNKKNREIYVGNLLVGVVQADTLRQLFDSALAAAFPNAHGGKPVVNVQMASDFKYAFVELQTEEMASAAIQLNGMELCNRPLNIARPSGWVDPRTAANVAAQAAAAMEKLEQGSGPVTNAIATPTLMSEAAVGAAPVAAPAVPGSATEEPPLSEVVCLLNLVTEAELTDDEEYKEVCQDLEEECAKCGRVVAMKIPRAPAPGVALPADFDVSNVGKVFVRFSTPDEARAAIELMQGRMFDGRRVGATSIALEEFEQVSA